jgi:SAM-dependent methyltransferase
VRDDEVRELLTPEGLRLLDSIPPYGSGRDVLRVSADLRKAGHRPALVAAVLTQARLRERARGKFGEFADRMLFTEAGLEQATRLPVAALHAGRYARAGLPVVADLGCGIGGDAMALAALDREVLAVERDPATAAIAAYNLAPFPSVTVIAGDAESTPLAEGTAVFLDPARRTTGGTRVAADEWTPSLDFCFATAAERPTGMKLAPAFDRTRIPADLEAQWVTAAGETVELTLWSGPLARPGIRRSAVVLTQDGAAELTAAGDTEDANIAPLGRYVFEPAGSVIRARLIGDLARAVGAGMLSPGIAYLTGDRLAESPFLAAFEVTETLPLDERRIARVLRERGIGRLEIKKRGVDVDPAAFRKKLAPRGDGEATLILAPVAGRRTAILATRVAQPGSVTTGASTEK